MRRAREIEGNRFSPGEQGRYTDGLQCTRGRGEQSPEQRDRLVRVSHVPEYETLKGTKLQCS